MQFPVTFPTVSLEFHATADKMPLKSRKKVNFSAIEDKNKKKKARELQKIKAQKRRKSHGRLPGYNRLT